jgi:hypothetical protein
MATNLMATNAITGTNGSGIGRQDLALTEFDRKLIIRFRATLIQKLGGTAAAWAPVTLQSDNGVVTVGGAVPSIVIKQRVVATLNTFPGVVRVIDQLSVDTNMNATTPGVSVVPNGPFPGSFSSGPSNNEAVLAPTGRPTTPTTPVPRAFPGAATNPVPVPVPGTTP